MFGSPRGESSDGTCGPLSCTYEVCTHTSSPRQVGEAPRYSHRHWAPLFVGTTKGNWGGFKHKAVDGTGRGWILIRLDGRGVCLPSGLGH